MSEKINYWKLSKEQIEELCKQRDLEIINDDDKNMNRKDTIAQLVMYDAIEGKLKKSVVISDDNVQYVGEDKPYVIIKFSNTEQGSRHVPVGLNGDTYIFPRDQWVLMPKELLNVINDAVSYETKQKINKNGDIVTYQVPVHRYPYQLKAA